MPDLVAYSIALLVLGLNSIYTDLEALGVNRQLPTSTGNSSNT